jgi:glycyl-radical enzyme activating protein family
MNNISVKGLIFDIQGFAVHDGPGIRTTVFMKGCPLKCKWCANPESQKFVPEIFHTGSRCVNCGRCIEACPECAVSFQENGRNIGINRAACDNCSGHACVSGCYQGAMELAGRYMSVDELMAEVVRDDLFYRNSGGGVTLCGGEPLSQPEFTLQFLKKCKEEGIHTNLDTCGYAPWEAFSKILEYTDMVYYDIKSMDPEVHKELTGVSNELILKNLGLVLKQTNIPVYIRIPVIPRYNDSKENMGATAQFIRQAGAKQVNILPYHRLGVSKYKRLGKEYPLNENVIAPSDAAMKEIKSIFDSYNLCCKVGG